METNTWSDSLASALLGVRADRAKLTEDEIYAEDLRYSAEVKPDTSERDAEIRQLAAELRK